MVVSVDPRPSRARQLLVSLAGGTALLGASLVNFLHHNDYPLFRPEVGILFAGLLAICVVMAFVHHLRWARPVLEGLLAALFVDFNTDSRLLILAVAVGVMAFTAWRRISLMGPIAVLGSVVMLTTLTGVGGSPSWIRTIERDHNSSRDASGKPAIVHIVLDEHSGLEGLTDQGPDGQRLRDELRAFYSNSGFAIYGGAYSQHYHTSNSVPYILNFGTALAQSANKRGIRSGPTRHLQNLVDQGYRLTIFESDFADFCTHANFDECVTYESSSLRPTLAAPIGIQDRTSLILHKFLALSDLSLLALFEWNRSAAKIRPYGISLPGYHWLNGNSSSIGTLEAFPQLLGRLAKIRAGEAVFAHLLLPHHPYVVGRDCSFLPWPWEGLRTDGSPQVKRAAYREQVRCTTRKIAEALKAISRSPAGANVVVILHGDHGSRISQIDAGDQTSGKYSDTDMIEVFSTLFAIRAPGVTPAYYEERQPVSALLRDFAASGFRYAPHPKAAHEHWVYLTNPDWKPVGRVRLSSSWTHSPEDNAGTGHEPRR